VAVCRRLNSSGFQLGVPLTSLLDRVHGLFCSSEPCTEQSRQCEAGLRMLSEKLSGKVMRMEGFGGRRVGD
jgi:hypothetical protein